MPVTTARQQGTRDSTRAAERVVAGSAAEIRAAIEAHPEIDRTEIERKVLAEVDRIESAMRETDSRLWSEAHLIADRAGEMAAREIEEAIIGFDLDQVDQKRAGVALVLDHLDHLGLTDEIAGVTPLDDVARRLRRSYT